ncbi:MAG TPA: hypothetical protein VIM62_12130 [Acidobacteriaceae bacterium]
MSANPKHTSVRCACTLRIRPLRGVILLSTALLAISTALHGQEMDKTAARSIQTFYLHNVATQSDFNDVQTALRNMLPQAKLYGVPHIAAITLSASAADLTSAQKLITDLDRAKKTWRLIYTVTEIDNDKAATPQHFSLIIAEGAKAYLKQGTKVPIVTGKYDTEKPGSGPETQVQYLDVGLNFDISLDGYQDTLRLKTKFEQSAVVDDKGQHTDDPILSQTTMETTSALEPGKETALGSVAEPNSPHHVQVSVIAEAVK